VRQTTGLHEDLSRETVGRRSSDREFGLVMAGVFVVLALFPLARGGHARVWPVLPAAAFVVAVVVYPRVLAPLNAFWLRFGTLLHRVVSPIILGVLFFAVLTPFGVTSRVIRKDPLRLRRDPGAPTYWIDREAEVAAPQGMTRQF
jgi:hypothetical protein